MICNNQQECKSIDPENWMSLEIYSELKIHNSREKAGKFWVKTKINLR